MGAALAIVAKLLGLDNGASVTNKALGGANLLALLGVVPWLWLHREDILTFHIDVGSLALIAMAVYAMLEFNRRN